MTKTYWLMKSEPDVYGWDDLVAEGEGTWDGVRNHTAARNLRDMKRGDEAFFYHSNIGLEIVGVMRVSKAGMTDPKDPTGKWAAVKVEPVRKLKRPVSLKEIKATPDLGEMELVAQSRLSVSAVRPDEWNRIVAMSKRKAPGTV
ncbi:MAG TPA: EVE domain-containing protein [Novosphingobium sp.]|nr:EVE domain-containing protein [Novosphingobium sp.]